MFDCPISRKTFVTLGISSCAAAKADSMKNAETRTPKSMVLWAEIIGTLHEAFPLDVIAVTDPRDHPT